MNRRRMLYTRVHNRFASSKSRVTNERNSLATPIRSALSLSVASFPFVLPPLPLRLRLQRATNAPPTETKSKGSGQSGALPPGCTHTYAPCRADRRGNRPSTHVHAFARASTGMKTAIPVFALQSLAQCSPLYVSHPRL